MEVKIKLIYNDSVMPVKAHREDAGFDCTAHSINVTDNYTAYGLGFAVEIPRGYVGLLFPRSSSRNKSLIMANCIGVIDYGYTGEVIASFKRLDIDPVSLKQEFYVVGEKCAQLIIMPIPDVDLIQVQEISGGVRGSNGHGSTDKK